MNIEKPEPNWSFLDQLDWNPCFLFKEPWSSSRGFGGGGCCGGCCCLGARHRRGYPRRDMKLEGVQCSCQVQPTVTYNSSSPLMQAGPVPGDKGLKDVSSFGQWPRSSKALLKNPIVLSHVVTYTPCLHIFGFARIFHLYQMIYHLAAFRTCYSQVTWVRSNSFFTSLKQLIQTTTWLGSSHSSYSSGISLGVSFDGQSGYTRSADDPLLALTELSLSEKKCFFAFLGDLSLPFTWGEDMLLLDANCPNFTGGQLHLVGDILSFDVVRVCLGGKSTVIVKQGLPEGGCLGPLLYWYEYCGIVVVVYASVFLSQMLGKSKPGLAEVFHKMNGLQEFLTDSSLAVQHLPVSAALRGNQQNLEALAARALDPIRVLMSMFLLPHLGAKCVEWFSFLNAGLLRTGIAGQNVFFCIGDLVLFCLSFSALLSFPFLFRFVFALLLTDGSAANGHLLTQLWNKGLSLHLLTLLRWLVCAWLMLCRSLLLCASLSPKLMAAWRLVGGCTQSWHLTLSNNWMSYIIFQLGSCAARRAAIEASTPCLSGTRLGPDRFLQSHCGCCLPTCPHPVLASAWFFWW